MLAILLALFARIEAIENRHVQDLEVPAACFEPSPKDGPWDFQVPHHGGHAVYVCESQRFVSVSWSPPEWWSRVRP